MIDPDGFVRGFFSTVDSLGVSAWRRLLAVSSEGGVMAKRGVVDDELPDECVGCSPGDDGAMDNGDVVDVALGKCCWTGIGEGSVEIDWELLSSDGIAWLVLSVCSDDTLGSDDSNDSAAY